MFSYVELEVVGALENVGSLGSVKELFRKSEWLSSLAIALLLTITSLFAGAGDGRGVIRWACLELDLHSTMFFTNVPNLWTEGFKISLVWLIPHSTPPIDKIKNTYYIYMCTQYSQMSNIIPFISYSIDDWV